MATFSLAEKCVGEWMAAGIQSQSMCSVVLEHVRVFMSIMYHVLLLLHCQYSEGSVFHCNHGNWKWQMAELWKCSGCVWGWMTKQTFFKSQSEWIGCLAFTNCIRQCLKILQPKYTIQYSDWAFCRHLELHWQVFFLGDFLFCQSASKERVSVLLSRLLPAARAICCRAGYFLCLTRWIKCLFWPNQLVIVERPNQGVFDSFCFSLEF